jgi:alpha-beta hydrolase superfamily lysophospholipase
MDSTRRPWKDRLKDFAIVFGLIALVLLFSVYVWYHRETNPVQPGAFYTPPQSLPVGAPGTIIRTEELTRGVPKGAKAWRILYTSNDLNDQPIAVSGLVIAPTAPADEPREIIAIAPGTQGIYPACAISQLNDPFTGNFSELQTMIDEGFVVVRTDYPGLGTPGVHPYLVGKEEGQTVLDSVRAAHNLVPETGTDYAIIGASQGGHAAMFASQMAPDYASELDLVGTVTQAGAFDLAAILESHMDDKGSGVLFPYVFYAWSSVYPDVSVEGVVAPKYQKRIEQLAHTCITTPLAYLNPKGIPTGSEFLAIDPVTTEPWKDLIAENTPTGPVSTPLLLVHGSADEVIPFQGSVDEAARRCAEGEDVTFLRYPLAPHAAVPQSMLTAVGWVEDRFAGRPSTSNCAERAAPGSASP